MAWNPVNSTQLVAACDHHLSPTLHRWDLRSPNMPFELLGHDQVGILSQYCAATVRPDRLTMARGCQCSCGDGIISACSSLSVAHHSAVTVSYLQA